MVSVRSGVQLRLRLPFVTRDQVDLARSGDELVVTVGSYRRLLTLPERDPVAGLDAGRHQPLGHRRHLAMEAGGGHAAPTVGGRGG